MTTDSCGTCNFSLQDGPNLFCRRYPPQAFIGIPSGPLGVPGTVSTMPPIASDMWCGEFAAIGPAPSGDVPDTDQVVGEAI